MKAIKAHFDGKNVVVPPDAEGLPPGEVLLIFNDSSESPDLAWLRAQEPAFAKVWDNDEDAAYDEL
jgi:hypothetical protein